MNISNSSNSSSVNLSNGKQPSIDQFADCNFSDYLTWLNVNAYWGQYAVFMPCYFVFGLISRGLCLLAFYHQAKIEPAYLFQIFVAVIELVQVFALAFYTQTRYLWSGISRLREPWFMKCWFCMWVDAHISNPFQMSTGVCLAMLTLCMTLDRIYALANPMKYNQNQNRKKQQWAIFIFCILFSSLLAFPDVFFFFPEWDDNLGMYKNSLNLPWLKLILALVNVQLIFKVIFTIALALANTVLAVLYQRRVKNRAKMANRNEKKEAEEMEKVRTLFWLTFIQSILDIISSLSDFIYNFIVWLVELFGGNAHCLNGIVPIFVDFLKAATDMADFYVVFAIMPSFRRMVIKSVKHVLKIGEGKAINISRSGNTGSTVVTKPTASVNASHA